MDGYRENGQKWKEWKVKKKNARRRILENVNRDVKFVKTVKALNSEWKIKQRTDKVGIIVKRIFF